jgi:diaminohydroxyphosphoribosylaminopyrimidine deaminase/5-amino-6-(5-phosphoribosylamino)uracil reductase
MSERILSTDEAAMQYALGIALRGRGGVEPNPCVGAVILNHERQIIGEGYHQHYGGPHAEVFALEMAGTAAAGATLYVTLEPCSHHGKTPPCAEAVIKAGIGRVVVGCIDPNPQVSGRGVQQLQQAGIEVIVGCLEAEARELIAPFRTLKILKRPYIHGKWAMSLDGKMATRTGHSQWISSPASREFVHQMRCQMDAILVGARTAIYDNPLLTARPLLKPENRSCREPLRIVLNHQAQLALDSNLVQTSKYSPVLLVVSKHANSESIANLQAAGIEILQIEPGSSTSELMQVMSYLGQKQLTHLLVEGGSQTLGSFADAGLLDEVHVFIAPKLVGGEQALTPVGGHGLKFIPELENIDILDIRTFERDLYIHGRIRQIVDPLDIQR